MKEIKDIAQWEETDSELAKYTICKLNHELNVSIKVAKSLAQDLENATNKIDKALELLDSYKLGKYDYALTPAGLLELEDILRGEE